MSLLDELGLRPDGDPDGMRAYASRLRAAAEQVQTAGGAAAAAVDHMTFVGPAGNATRDRASHLRSRSRAAASELRQLADDITRRAGDIEHRQSAWDRLQHAIEQEIHEAARDLKVDVE